MIILSFSSRGQDLLSDVNEEHAIDMIFQIPEIVSLSTNEKYQSLGKKLNLITNRKPDSMFKYYWITVGLADDNRFEPLHDFYVLPQKKQIYYFDFITDSLLSLNDWRNRTLRK